MGICITAYPDNILEKLKMKAEDIPNDFTATLYYLVCETCKFDTRAADMLMMCFKEGYTLDEVGKHYGITGERVRQIIDKRIGVLLTNPWMDILKMGLQKYHQEDKSRAEDYVRKHSYYDACNIMCKEITQAVEKAFINTYGYELIDDKVDKMELSVRAYNCLMRSGIKTVRDIIYMGKDNLCKVRNLGRASYDEIVNALVEKYGEKEYNWKWEDVL